MTRSPEEQPELLPGMVRATVQASQAKARATRARSATEAAVATTDPVAASWSTCRWPTWTGRSTTGARHDGRDRGAGRPGQGALRRPGRRRVRRRPRRDHRARAAGQPAPGRQPRARAHPEIAALTADGRSATPAPARTCCASRSPPGTTAEKEPRPRARGARSTPRPPRPARPRAGRGLPPAPGRRRSPAPSGRGARHRLAAPARPPPRRRTPAVAARCSASPTARTSPASTARSRRCWATATTSR